MGFILSNNHINKYMKKVMLLTLIIIGITSSSAQEKIQLFLVGGYEHCDNDDIASNAGYGIGLEFRYQLYKKLYAVANFHTGISKDFKSRTAIAEFQEVDFSMQWKTQEYKAGIGLGVNILEIKNNYISTQATFGLSKVKYSFPIVAEYSPNVKIENRNNIFFKCASSVSLGYNYKISKYLFVGIDYTGWWLINFKYRHTCNAKIGISF